MVQEFQQLTFYTSLPGKFTFFCSCNVLLANRRQTKLRISKGKFPFRINVSILILRKRQYASAKEIEANKNGKFLRPLPRTIINKIFRQIFSKCIGKIARLPVGSNDIFIARWSVLVLITFYLTNYGESRGGKFSRGRSKGKAVKTGNVLSSIITVLHRRTRLTRWKPCVYTAWQ